MYKMITEEIYIIGGPMYSSPSDCLIYIVGSDDCMVMIDAGFSDNISILEENLMRIGRRMQDVEALILTHCHIDHIGGASAIKNLSGCDIYAHELDSDAIEGKNPKRTAQHWYGVDYTPVKVDVRLKNDVIIKICNKDIYIIHTPGHTPGSLSVLLESCEKKVLFAQDVHGPLHEDFGSNASDWKKSLRKMLSLNADILCEGHYGVFQPAEKVREYIERYLEM